MPAEQGRSAADLIRAYGDDLEKVIYADDAFACQFKFYALLWAGHILPNRQEGTLSVKPYWSSLAECSYSAIVRCWNTYESKRSIAVLCVSIIDRPSPATLLALHGELAKFFWCAGAAIDNIMSAYQASPACLENTQILADRETFGSLGWFFDRRSQYIHKITVPLQIINDLAHVNPEHYKAKSVSWQEIAYVNPKEVSQMVEEAWILFCRHMNNAWARLYSHLSAVQPKKDQSPQVQYVSIQGVSGWPGTGG
jgi:hypothetical protein